MDTTARTAIDLAASLAVAAGREQTRAERAEAARLARMMKDSAGKAFTVALVDRVFRSHQRGAQGKQLRELLHRFGAPRYLAWPQRVLLESAGVASRLMPDLAMPLVEGEVRRASAGVVLSAEPLQLARYLARRAAAGTRVNLNHLGEAVLGEAEAQRRLQTVLNYLADPAIRYVSVKISAIFSQINTVDFAASLEVIKSRLRTLYRAAMASGKFVNLDMEEYRDLEMTLAAFRGVLEEPEFLRHSAGIALQAYLPDSWTQQQRLTQWARQRVAAGGVPVKLRLVKGANLTMERVEAELHGWNAAPYSTKAETDANYCRMLEFGCRRENAAAVHLGVATHNLFDVALGLVLREQNGVVDSVELEMLEGMANHQARAVQARAGGLLVYAPIVQRADFISAIAYLVRRFEENTAPENFLHDLFQLTPGTAAWERQAERFVAAWENRLDVSADSRRARVPAVGDARVFRNAADTDWTQSERRTALAEAIRDWEQPQPPAPAELEDVVATAVGAQPGWKSLGQAGRAAILRQCAAGMEGARFKTIVEMMHEGKKSPAEADAEVSEAIDHARYLASAEAVPAGLRVDALGVVVVAPPWNFPYAIPAIGTLAALAAGNAVILKPAPETVAIAWRLAQHLWQGGVPRDVLQFFPGADGQVGQALITHRQVGAVVLTGAYETARLFLSWRPGLRLFAETSGKNAIVITANADRDLAIKDLLKSAFGHAGQKCSAASLAILHAELYDDAKFLATLRDAAASLKVGPATDLGSIVTPLIREPGAALRRALTTLDEGETWLLEPHQCGGNPCLWSPGIKMGVKAGSWFHQTECFGPVLEVMRAENLEEAIRMQNGTPFGLTGGLHSLDEEEIAVWKEKVCVGNAYINRGITGAIVQRQPFGGWKRSSVGPGAPAGGPHYLWQFVRIQAREETADDFEEAWERQFSGEHDPSALRSESNVQRYRRCRGVLVRLDSANGRDVKLAERAAEITGARVQFSFGSDESEEELAARLPGIAADVEFLRTTRVPGDRLLEAAYGAGVNWIDAPLVPVGFYELPRWLRQQTVSQSLHRYGLLPMR